MISRITKLALSVRPVGRKLKHFIDALPQGLDETTAAAVRAEAFRIDALRAERRSRRPVEDQLLAAARTRAARTSSAHIARAAAIEAWRTEAAEREAAGRRQVDHERQLEERAAGARKSLLAAARIARGLGYSVSVSRDRAGRVSSYYITRGDGAALRISDHDIPSTARRDVDAEARGSTVGYMGYEGPELILRRARSAPWLRRAIRLALAGRSVPGI